MSCWTPTLPRPPPRRRQRREQGSQFTLKNGLQLVVIPDHRAPVVTHMVGTMWAAPMIRRAFR